MKGISTQASDLRDYDVIKTLGEGSFAKVYQVVRRSDGMTYAMKRCKMGLMKLKDKENALNEVRILSSIANPYVIAYKEAIYEESSECLYVIMEYAAGGDLMEQVKAAQRNHTLIDEYQIWVWAYEMILGLKGLHDQKILHRDLKCANIFLDAQHKAKIGDLNVSKFTQSNLATTQVGTPYYTSPEVWNHQMYSHKSDIWSLGCLLYELCALEPPFTATDMSMLFKKVTRGVYDRIPSRYSNELSHLIAQCLHVNEVARLDCDSLLALPSMRRMIEEFNINGDIVAQYASSSGRGCSQQLQPSSSSTSSRNLHEMQKYLRPTAVQDVLPKPAYNQENISNNAHSQQDSRNLRRTRSNTAFTSRPPAGNQAHSMLESEIQRRINRLNQGEHQQQQQYLQPIQMEKKRSERIMSIDMRLQENNPPNNNNYMNRINPPQQLNNSNRNDKNLFKYVIDPTSNILKVQQPQQQLVTPPPLPQQVVHSYLPQQQQQLGFINRQPSQQQLNYVQHAEFRPVAPTRFYR